MDPLKDIVIIYHAHCYDGFGAAYAAWKKFGEIASYVPCADRDEYPAGVESKEVYVADFCFSAPVTGELVKRNRSVVILDHHETSKALVQSRPGSVFSETDSGAKIAWNYFHPDAPVPKLIDYISDADTWAHALPSWQEVESYVHTTELSFEAFEALSKEIETSLDSVIEKGKVLHQYFNKLVEEHMEKARLVEFEGYRVYAVNASSFLRSELGHRLALKQGPLSIVYRFEGDALKVSLRGDGTVDCSTLAEKYGGGGHHDAAALLFKHTFPLPFPLA
jgi:oligoribonuclease NrnB/cAMP/cGMP phosphodiesterase (DHH superfamily)